MIVYVIR